MLDHHMGLDADISAREALRLLSLPDDDPATAVLSGIVDKINALRAIQADEAKRAIPTAPETLPAHIEAIPEPAELTKRGPGRPRKVES